MKKLPRSKSLVWTEIEPRTWIAEELQFIHPALILQRWQVKAAQRSKRA